MEVELNNTELEIVLLLALHARNAHGRPSITLQVFEDVKRKV
jgi:predicted small metal-binding protein